VSTFSFLYPPLSSKRGRRLKVILWVPHTRQADGKAAIVKVGEHVDRLGDYIGFVAMIPMDADPCER
jgi:hypothetical protein